MRKPKIHTHFAYRWDLIVAAKAARIGVAAAAKIYGLELSTVEDVVKWVGRIPS